MLGKKSVAGKRKEFPGTHKGQRYKGKPVWPAGVGRRGRGELGGGTWELWGRESWGEGEGEGDWWRGRGWH